MYVIFQNCFSNDSVYKQFSSDQLVQDIVIKNFGLFHLNRTIDLSVSVIDYIAWLTISHIINVLYFPIGMAYIVCIKYTWLLSRNTTI